MAVQTIRLYLEPSGIADVAHASQLDTQRQFKFLIYDENGAYTFPSGSEVSINGQKADGYLFDYTESDYVGNVHIISKSGNQVIVNTTQQMTAYPGNVACQIRISKDGQDLGVLPFTMFVQKTPLADEQGFSQSDLPSIVKKYNEFTEDSEAWAVGKRNGVDVTSGDETYHNNSKYYSQQASSSASTASTKATQAANSATTASNKATAAANSASAAAASAAEAESYTAHPPYIGANGNWYVWNITQAQYVDSGIDASITVEIADITMIDYGATPYVTNTGTNTDPIFHLFLPRYKTAYEFAVDGGYDRTEAEFDEELKDFKDLSDSAVSAASRAAISEANAQASKERAVLAETNSSASETNANQSALDAEAWAVGQRNGVDVSQLDETFENNSKYYASLSQDIKDYVAEAWQEMAAYYKMILATIGTSIRFVTESGDSLVTEDGNNIIVDY